MKISLKANLNQPKQCQVVSPFHLPRDIVCCPRNSSDELNTSHGNMTTIY